MSEKKLPKVLFCYLKAFDATGGLERFNQSFIKSLAENQRVAAAIFSVYDSPKNIPSEAKKNFSSTSGNKILFILKALRQSLRSDIVIFGHINLAWAIVLPKICSPRKKVVLITHGIDVWFPLSFAKKRALKISDNILTVSRFTKSILVKRQNVSPEKITIFPNTLGFDFLPPPHFSKPKYLLKRHTISAKQAVLLSLSRISEKDREKGYVQTLRAVAKLRESRPEVLFLMAGKYTEAEKSYLEKIIQELQIKNQVQIIGFVPDAELIDYYLLADVFVMPSRKEGFGIVFIEAAACGSYVIAGNADGSVDALQNGELGVLVSPENPEEIASAIKQCLQSPQSVKEKKELQKKVLDSFQFEKFSQNLDDFLCSLR